MDLNGFSFGNDNRIHHNFFDAGYLKLGLGGGDDTVTAGMSISCSAGVGSTVMQADNNSSVGSNSGNSRTRILHHPGLKAFEDLSTRNSVVGPRRRGPRSLDNDILAQLLMDPNQPTLSLGSYEQWAIDLSKLNMGDVFAQGAFGKLYRGTYNGEEVAIKLLERPENDPEHAQTMEQQFAQEVMLLSNLKHPNIVGFVGACRKQMVWCIVTEYAKGGSVRQFLMKRHHRSIPVRVAVRQALDVARGMAYVHSLGFIHRDLKSDNLLIFGDKSIKIADFGVARIEVKPEGMTPETGTYRWMAP
ncbi:uncharacterized protein A4U43_C01F35570 [Asparagus officinalis]|uniref:non-specific serine/threonine protein kinase n=2 Tax=Asparagus officinalis TaxID=4686 RepID=A0A5P1FUP8_ASPOF|nr:uncharacterized protein A4U43_C01F35570 [Asparagus officinalis]